MYYATCMFKKLRCSIRAPNIYAQFELYLGSENSLRIAYHSLSLRITEAKKKGTTQK